MAYAGTTSTSPNPPMLVFKAIGSTAGAQGRSIWLYASTHVSGDVAATDWFTDGHALGMTIGDVVMVVGSTDTDGGSGPLSLHTVNAVTVSSGVGLTSAGLASSAS